MTCAEVQSIPGVFMVHVYYELITTIGKPGDGRRTALRKIDERGKTLWTRFGPIANRIAHRLKADGKDVRFTNVKL